MKEAAKSMLADSGMNERYWAEAVSTACYTQNRCMINKQLNKMPYEIWEGRKPNISHFHIFGCKCFVHNNGKDQLRTFQAKADEAIFLGYSTTSKAFRVFNKRSLVVEESIHVVFNEELSLSDKRKEEKRPAYVEVEEIRIKTADDTENSVPVQLGNAGTEHLEQEDVLQETAENQEIQTEDQV